MDAEALVHCFFDEVMSQGRLDRCEDIVAGVYLEHALMPFGVEEPGSVPGPEHLRTVAGWLREQFPDLRMRVDHLVHDGALVAVLVTSEGTNTGRLNGVMPPTGRRFTARQSHWFRIEDGRLAEHWATRDDLTMLLQLGVVRPPGPPA